MYNVICRLALALVICCTLFPVHATEQSIEKVLRVGFPGEFSPFYYFDSNNEVKGASYETAKVITKQLGYQLEITRFESMQKLFEEIKHGRIDMVINLTSTEQRRKFALFTRSAHIYETQDIVIRADSDFSFQGKLDSLTPYRIGTISGWTYGDDFDSAPYLQKILVNDPDEQLRGLLSGEFDIAINNREFFQFNAQRLGVKNAFKVVEPAVFTLPVNIAISKKYPDATALVQQIELAVQAFKKTEQYQAILDKYGFKRPKDSLKVTP